MKEFKKVIFYLDNFEEYIFKDGEKEYKFNKQEFIKKFCLEEKII